MRAFPVLPRPLLVVIALLLGSLPAAADHFKGGAIAWRPASEVGLHGVEIDLRMAFTRHLFSGTGSDGFPLTGDTFYDTEGYTFLHFGDGSAEFIEFEVIAHDIDRDWLLCAALDPLTGERGVDHVYPAADDAGAPWVAYIDSCCRDLDQENNPSGRYRLETIIECVSGNSSPVAAANPVFGFPAGIEHSFPFLAADADLGSVLSYRLSDPDEAGDGFVQPDASGLGGGPLFIDADTGWITWDSTGTAPGDSYSCQVTIEDRDSGTGDLRTRVAYDFLLLLTPADSLPTLAMDPAPPFTVPVSSTLTFEVTANPEIPGSTIALNQTGLPEGASLTPELPATGAPDASVTSEFLWVPSSGDVGAHAIVFIATDILGQTSVIPVSIVVTCDVTILASPDASFACEGDDVLLEVTAAGAEPLSYQWRRDGADIAGATTPSLLLAAVTAGDTGSYDVRVTSPCEGEATSAPAEVVIGPCGTAFLRGDCNVDGTLDIADPVWLLRALFLGAEAGSCPEACDADDDGELAMADVFASLSYLFQFGPVLPEPFTDCALDLTPDAIGCEAYTWCP